MTFENSMNGDEENFSRKRLLFIFLLPCMHQGDGEVVTARTPELKEVDNDDFAFVVCNSTTV